MSFIDRKKVSVIIPTYGRPEYLRKAITSVLQQDYANIEIVVIDDNHYDEAHDKTKALLAPFIKDKKIVYYHDGINRGGALARNKGIKLASGFYITFLDDDDSYLPEKVSKQVQHIESSCLDVSVCDMYFLENRKLKNVSNCYARVESGVSFALNGNAYTPMIMTKKSVLIDIECFTDTPRWQDHVLMLKLFIANKKIGHLPVQLFFHNNHDKSRITKTKKIEEAYHIRKSLEKQFILQMTPSELKQYHLKDLLVCSKILRVNSSNKEAYRNILESLGKISSLADFHKIIKTFIRITFFKNRTI